MDSEAAETYLRLLAESQLRRAVTSARYAWLDPDFQLGGEPPTEVHLLRMQAAARALSLAGALDAATAGPVVSGLAAALAVRGHARPGSRRPAYPAYSVAEPPDPAALAPRVPAAPPGPLRAVPVGAAFGVEVDDQRGTVHLLTLVSAPDRAAITVAYADTWAGLPGGSKSPAPPEPPSFPPFGGSGAADDQGRRYRLHYAEGSGGWQDGCLLELSPVPPPGARWLEVATGPGPSALRVRLDGPSAEGVFRQAATARSPGEHLLYSVADALVGGGLMVGTTARLLATGLAEVVAAMEACGALPPGSPAPGRLAALCRHCGIEVTPGLLARAAVGVPDAWASVLGAGRPEDGPEGTAPAAVVLPEVDGARFVVAGLRSSRCSASLHLLAWGWRPVPREFRPDQPFSWWARDDAGRWHAGRVIPDSGGAADFLLGLSPPLHPEATSLEVILTGRSGRATATVPLAWARGDPSADVKI